MKFYRYSQNNSGGVFNVDESRGIGHEVYVEAPSAHVANARAEDIGLYFDSSQDCPCCGSRWSSAWESEPSWNSLGSISEIYESIKETLRWSSFTTHIYAHLLDGTIIPIMEDKKLLSSPYYAVDTEDASEEEK